MSYIICAEVNLEAEENHAGKIENVEARTLSTKRNYITFEIHGEFDKQKELTKKLCLTLIESGFVAFEIRHSY